MLVAELSGKIPSILKNREDILTSNVFSYFKYSDREILNEYLNLLGLDVNAIDCRKAEFIFWPKYDDKTEPDLVLVCGKYYILIEAKLYSDFAHKTDKIDSQITREIQMGKLASLNLRKDFVYIALTAEYYKDPNKYKKIEGNEFRFIWSNWQLIAEFLENRLQERSSNIDLEFSRDLYQLLLKKKLRSFKGLSYTKFDFDFVIPDCIFYNVQSSKFKGNFSGYLNSLEEFDEIQIFESIYKKSFFSRQKNVKFNIYDKVFYHDSKSK